MLNCDGLRGQKNCTSCLNDNDRCTWPDAAQIDPTVIAGGGAELPQAEQQGSEIWNGNLSPTKLADLARAAQDCTLLEPEAGKPYFLVVHSKRRSSQEAGGYQGVHFQGLVAQHPLDVQLYATLLANPAQVPECDQPLGIQRDLCLVFWRQGTLPIPIIPDGLAHPYLIAFTNEMQRITRPAVHRPQETHLLTWGISGLSTDIHAFGSRQSHPVGNAAAPAGVAPPAPAPAPPVGPFVPIPVAPIPPVIPVHGPPNAGQAPANATGDGLIGLLLDANRRNGDQHFEKTTHLVTLVEPHVVDGSSAASLAGAGIITPHFYAIPYSNKYVL